ncbi:phosphate acetyltransferase [Breoghania sp. JC706]|uniref:phosphate acetyltransferase n=1 Tax=Breoghania sp. JC706 TaxID=3117732 RepID=UPI0030097C77
MSLLEIGRSASTTRTFDETDALGYAELSGLAERPQTVPEPLIGGLFSYLLGVKVPGFGTNYLKQDMRFLVPAPFGAPLTATVTVTRLRPEKHLVDLETVCETAEGQRICEGRALVYVEDVGK